MKQKFSYARAFRQMRQLPLEVDFTKVEQWVRIHPLANTSPPLNWWQKIRLFFR